jgi:tetratricopeptide (TPR) repeat protein
MRTVIAIFTCALILSLQHAYGQTPVTTSYADEVTYRHWANQEWDDLIKAGNEALKHGIDFYYLRYRLGIAWYEKSNYQKASRHFQKAWDMNPSDDTLNEYLYYSFVLSGWTYEASSLKNRFTNRHKQDVGLRQSDFWKQLYASYSYQAGASDIAIGRFDATSQAEGYQTISRGYHLFNLGAEHRLTDHMWLHHSYTHIQKEVFRYINTGEFQEIDPTKKIWLNQYYLGAAILLKPRIDVKFGFHYLNTLYYEDTLLTGQGPPRIASTSFTNHNFAGFVSMNRRFDGGSTGITSYIANLNSATQFQLDVRLTMTPFGNPNLYTTSIFSLQTEKNGADTRQGFIFNQIAGMKVFERMWAEAGVTYGDVSNVMSNYGMITFNDPDIIKKMMGFRLYFLFTNHTQIRLNTTFFDKQSRFLSTTESTGLPHNISYSTHSLSATLLWNF